MDIIVLRRKFIQSGLAMGALAMTPGALGASGSFADELAKTPPMTEGPFYPSKLPLDTDNDLLIINDSVTSAVGEVTHLTGRVLSQAGEPIRNAVVEIWQCDARGVYMHPDGGDRKKIDTNFQGFGRFLTDVKGQYYFRTIKPVAYPGRTPHIHFAVNYRGKRILATQCFNAAEPQNARDGLLARIADENLRNSLIVDFNALEGSKIGELTANFDIVVGVTPEDPDH